MSYYVYHTPNGEITVHCNPAEGTLPNELSWCTFLEVPESVTRDTHKIVDSVPVEYSTTGKNRRNNKPGLWSVWNPSTEDWDDPRVLQELKSAQWETVKAARTAAEYAGFTWDGFVFDSDAISQNRITGAVTLAMLSPEFVINWVLADNTTRLLDQSSMAQVGGALGAHVAAQFAHGVTLRAQIEAATTQAEVEAIVW